MYQIEKVIDFDCFRVFEYENMNLVQLCTTLALNSVYAVRVFEELKDAIVNIGVSHEDSELISSVAHHEIKQTCEKIDMIKAVIKRRFK